MAELSPMMSQYLDIKEQNKDSILFFRLGDFYEMFFDDAKLASRELDLTLTARDCGQKEKAPMCGVPYHSCEAYIARLVAKGYKVAICEQLEEASVAKGIVKRDVIRVITPGTVLESSMLDEAKNNFICSLFINSSEIGLCFCDISTGSLYATKFVDEESNSKLINELSRFMPREILVGGNVEKLKNLSKFIKEKLSACVEMIEDYEFEYKDCRDVLLSHFEGKSLEQLQLCEMFETVSSLGVLIKYLRKTQRIGLERIGSLEIYNDAQFMNLDMNTRRNLELMETMISKDKKGSLLWVLDKTKTAMGKRLLRIWLEQPLLNCIKILKRQNAVNELFSNSMLRDSVREVLSGVHDIERIMTKIVYGSANGRELRSILSTVLKLPDLKEVLIGSESALLKEIYENLDTLDDIKELIDGAIIENPPVSIKEGGIIKPGYNKEADELREIMERGKDFIASLEAEERKITNIPKLKIGYNRVFGYYIEVTNSYKNMVPESYIRKQTLANCERYITQELKELESKILGAKDRLMQIEYRLFEEVRGIVSNQLSRVQKVAKYIAKLDVLSSFAQVAAKNSYCCPEVNVGRDLYIKDGRHPVVELLLDGAPFVSNDLNLDTDGNRVAIITGPNMAGKSTYMRQTAIITLMAQIGSFVPAKSAKIGIVDSIFTRVGASDDLSSGQSTFMVEMTEVANIIKNATNKSLLILDEIGRGTSTFDGMSIARSVLEHVANKKKLGAKTLFSTHYHELTELGNILDGVKNYNVAVKKRGDDITFLRRIVPGGADDSYGIEVAKLAGVPESIISRAKEILADLESGKSVNYKKPKNQKNSKGLDQVSMISSCENILLEKLKNLDVNSLTPIEAMNELFKLVKIANK